MQLMAVNWLGFGLGLVGALVWGIIFAVIVRRAATTGKGLKGQTAWSVVVGVAVTLATAVWAFGILFIALIGCFFVASGTPMIIEYLQRIQQEMQKDQKDAQELARDFLNESQTRHR